MVPLATHYEPCLKHAVIALASLHERYEKGDGSVVKSNQDIAEGGFALKQYNQAIQHLTNSPRKLDLDTFLVACVLFACFESLRGHSGSALSHIRSGVRILSQANETGQREQGHNETLDVIFARLDIQEAQVSRHYPLSLSRRKANAIQVSAHGRRSSCRRNDNANVCHGYSLASGITSDAPSVRKALPSWLL